MSKRKLPTFDDHLWESLSKDRVEFESFIDEYRIMCGKLESQLSQVTAERDRFKEVLEKISKEGTHIFWESRGMDTMEHTNTCPPCVAQQALHGSDKGDGK